MCQRYLVSNIIRTEWWAWTAHLINTWALWGSRAVAIRSSGSLQDLPGVMGSALHSGYCCHLLESSITPHLTTSSSTRELQGAVIPTPLVPPFWVPCLLGWWRLCLLLSPGSRTLFFSSPGLGKVGHKAWFYSVYGQWWACVLVRVRSVGAPASAPPWELWPRSWSRIEPFMCTYTWGCVLGRGTRMRGRMEARLSFYFFIQ